MANKYLITIILVLINALGLLAQVEEKYLEGAVPEVAGKVQFTREINAASITSKEVLFKLSEEWANQEFDAEKAEDGSFQRVLLTKADEDYLVCQGDEYLVFKSQVLSLDRTRIMYQLVVRTEEGKLTMQVKNIRYEYQDYKEIKSAEEMITDKVALNKKKGGLARHYDKFRTFTIDRVDELANSLQTYIYANAGEIKPAPSIQAEGSPAVTVAQPMIAATPMAGYKQMKAGELNEGIMSMFKDSWALVVTGADADAVILPAAWSGIGNFSGKPVSMAIVSSQNDEDETYTISFYTQIHKGELDKIEKGQKSKLTSIITPLGAAAFSEAWMILECKKVMEQPVTQSMIDDAQSKKWSNSSFDKLFMGEIVNVWAR